jgi:hypothetical protein
MFLLFGVVSAARSLANAVGADDPRSRWLIAVHDTAKAGFWLAFGAGFLAFGLLEEARTGRLLLVVGLALAGLRLFMATLLARQ